MLDAMPHDESPMTNTPGSTPSTTRLAVTWPTASGPVRATVSFLRDGANWKARIDAAEQSLADTIRAVLEDVSLQDQTRGAAKDASRPRQLSSIIASLQHRGLAVTELPQGDHSVKVELDARSGRQVASYEPMHPFATPDEELAKRIAGIVAQSLERPATELAQRITALLQEGDNAGAAALVREAKTNGVFNLPLDAGVLNALAAIDHRALSADDRRAVLLCLVATADVVQRQELGREAADLLLDDSDAGLDEAERTALETFKGVAMIRGGALESGLIILRRLSRRDDLDAGSRAWIWRNISIALPADNPEARAAAQRSADAFLEAGDKREAARSLGRAVACAMSEEPAAAISTFDKILRIIDGHGLQDRALRATTLHESAQMLSSVGRHPEAFDRAAQAATLRSGLIGHEPQRIASLYLAAFEARASGKGTEADDFEREARELAQRYESPRTALADRITELFRSYSPEAADALCNDAKAAGEPQVAAAVAIARVKLDPNLSDERKAEMLEEQLNLISVGDGTRRSMEPPLLFALGQLLDTIGERDRAALWLRRAHDADPLDFAVLSQLTQNLWDRERWGEAVVIIEKQIQRVGEPPGLVYAHARSLFEAGSVSMAIPRLRRAFELHAGQPEQQQFILSLLERALTIPISNPSEPLAAVRSSDNFINLAEATAAIHEFAAFVSAVKRMRFWTRKATKAHVWREKPEQFGQDLLHTYLAARFGDRAQVLEEIPAGWGRVDLLVQFMGGLTVMIELKMCGLTYSRSYAAVGEEQLAHYMANRRTHIGFLVVIDGRIRDFGNAVITNANPHMTIDEIFIDVRPTRKPL